MIPLPLTSAIINKQNLKDEMKTDSLAEFIGVIN